MYCARAQSYSHPSGRTGDPDDEPSENDYSHGFGNARGGGCREKTFHTALYYVAVESNLPLISRRELVCVYTVCVLRGGSPMGKAKSLHYLVLDLAHRNKREREKMRTLMFMISLQQQERVSLGNSLLLVIFSFN